jgi:hypothetical protein
VLVIGMMMMLIGKRFHIENDFLNMLISILHTCLLLLSLASSRE